MRESRFRFLCFVFVLCLFPQIATASPWTLPKESLAIGFDVDFQLATSEYLDSRSVQTLPLDAEFQSTSLRIGARYGFTDRFEGSFQIALKKINYNADPVVLGFPEGVETATVEEARGSILDFSRSAIGSADAHFTARYNILRGQLMLTNETVLKLPTGYDKPSSTLDEDGFVSDDVTLGDGQADLENSILAGLFLPESRTFFRSGLGFRFRFGDPGHQALANLKVGQFLGEKFIVFVGADASVTVISGTPIGETLQANSDNVTAANITADDFSPQPLYLDKDFINVGVGALFVATSGIEIQGSYNRTVFGRNLPVINAFTVGTSITIPNLIGEP